MKAIKSNKMQKAITAIKKAVKEEQTLVNMHNDVSVRKAGKQEIHNEVQKVAKAEETTMLVNMHNDVSRQSACKEASKTIIDKRLQTANVRALISANNVEATSQAQLIDLIVRSAASLLTVNEIAKQVMQHKSFEACFKSKTDYVDVLKRVKRHNTVLDEIHIRRTIKRNMYV